MRSQVIRPPGRQSRPSHLVRLPLRALAPAGKATGRLLLNWGVLIAVIVGVLAFRERTEAEARAPLPAPSAHLSVAQARQWRHFPRYHGVVPVLLYHGINNSNANYSVTPHLFADQMRALKIAGFHAITLAQYVDYVRGSRNSLPSRPVLLTFDDGRRDAFRYANNTLRDYGFHATMFTFASWPTTNPGFSLTWPELRSMQQSGIWSIQEHGGEGHEYVFYNAADAKGGIYAFRRYIPASSGRGGRLEDFTTFVHTSTSDITWGAHQFVQEIPGYRPLAFAVPYANYGQETTNDERIPRFMLPWLKRHFAVVFGGDYLSGGHGHPYQISGRFSPEYSYRITMDQKMSPSALYCRLNDWVTRKPTWMEYRCLRPPESPADLQSRPARTATARGAAPPSPAP